MGRARGIGGCRRVTRTGRSFAAVAAVEEEEEEEEGEAAVVLTPPDLTSVASTGASAERNEIAATEARAVVVAAVR